MELLEIDYPIKPYRSNQPWGVRNPSYDQFGYGYHNGDDYALLDDKGNAVSEKNVFWNLNVEGEVVRLGTKENGGWQPNGGGIYFGVLAKEERGFKDGQSCYVLLDLLHAKKILVKEGDVVKRGQLVMIADNTGFSTGPHCHGQYRRERLVPAPPGTKDSYRFRGDQILEDVDKNDMNNSFDPLPYYTGKYAEDYKEPEVVIPTPPAPQPNPIEEDIVKKQKTLIGFLVQFIAQLLEQIKKGRVK